ncbi:tocopherol cyclase family protein [Maribacter sp. ACAM166]|uniref:tocopherol cyclase family protein n=1 Tax=Maribacter sp. ACAM166 TaxID=2508996 RepID=UPI0010FDE4BC|nr:tocopherol cyclase family protein [Maribacter sp. ACAM166]TLP81744.1 hypothetical protein ES765_03410 [Maribacter sp. ACAM166]
MSKNGYSLTRFSKKNGYNWWWHSFVATHAETGKLKPFFIEYYVINPALWNGKIIWGQQKENKNTKKKPCYAMLKVGTWGEDKVQLHNFYDISDFYASSNDLNCKIGSNELTDSYLFGSVTVSEKEQDVLPEFMSGYGSLKWDLKVEKEVQFDMGYGTSWLFNLMGLFEMYWHVQGMKCKYKGEIVFNEEKYIVHPETSYGYQDKNWGKEYTNPWIWLNCNNFTSKLTDTKIDASLDVGGGCPKIFGIPLRRKILTAFYYKGEFIEFNFSKFWKRSHQQFSIHEDAQYLYWTVVSENRKFKIDVKFKCDKSKMLFITYESPNGPIKHTKLRNGGYAEGIVKLYKKEAKEFKLIDELEGSLGGCEYGEY